MAQGRIARRIALLCLLRAINITVSGACSQYAHITIDHTSRPSGTYYVFSFTRTNNIRDFDSEVRFWDAEFTRLLQCFMRQSANSINICEVSIPQNVIETSGSLYIFRASVVGNVSTGAGASPNNGEHMRRYYVCVLPDRLYNPQGISVLCTEQTQPSNCFNDTDACITLSQINTELKSYVHVLFRSEGQISVRYNSDIVVVDSCNTSTTTTGTISPSSGITTRTTASPSEETTATTVSRTINTTGTIGTINPATEDTGNANVSDKELDNTGLIVGAVCVSLLIIELIVIGILCWKLRVAIWKRGTKLSTDSTPTGVSTSNQSRPSTDNLMYNNQETYPLPETNHHNISSISTSDYISLDSMNSVILETPNGHIGNFKDDKNNITNDVQNGDEMKPNTYENTVNPYDDLIEPNSYQDSASAKAIHGEESDGYGDIKPTDEASSHSREQDENELTDVTDGKLKAETVITSKTINLTKPKAKKSEKFKEKKTEKNGPEYFNVA